MIHFIGKSWVVDLNGFHHFVATWRLLMSIFQSIRPRTELQFQMDLKLLRGPRENRPNNNGFVYEGAR